MNNSIYGGRRSQGLTTTIVGLFLAVSLSSASGARSADPYFKYYLNVKGEVSNLTQSNVILVIANAGGIPQSLSIDCMLFRYKIFDVADNADVTYYDPVEGCASGERNVILNPGEALKIPGFYPDISKLAAGEYRLEVYPSSISSPSAPIISTTFKKF